MTKKNLIFVIGMHRSGTSALCNTLNDLGVYFGHNFIETQLEINALGFWENKKCAEINEEIFRLLGINWYDICLLEHNWWSEDKFDKIKGEIRQFITSEFDANNLIAIKDPRLCKVLPLWKSALETSDCQLSAIVISRAPEEVALSLLKRDGLPKEYSYLLWSSYVLEAEENVSVLPSQHLTFGELLNDWKIVYRFLVEKLSFQPKKTLDDIEAEVTQHLQKKLKHHSIDQTQETPSSTSTFYVTAQNIYNFLASEASPHILDKQTKESKTKFYDFLKENRSFFELLIEQNSNLIETRKELFTLGESHSYALSVVKERDEQLADTNKELTKIGQEHSAALEVINERDNQLQKLTDEHDAQLTEANNQLTKLGQGHSAALKVINERDVQLGDTNDQLSKLGQEYSAALKIINERDEQLAVLNQQLSELGQEHSAALKVINERDEQLKKMLTPWGYISVVYNKILAPKNLERTTRPAAPIDVIVPIYNGYDDLRICLESVFLAQCQLVVNLVLINDASPDERIKPYLDIVLKENENVELLENTKNLGFVGTVNKGMRYHPDNDILLLNADTIVYDGWLDKIVDAAYQEKKTATITPFSNNATICSFPNFCEENTIPSVFSHTILDKCLEKVNKGKTLSIPTGVGFCMYIRRKVLDEIGYFDEEAFGRGYGEENDFCMRAAQKGWDNKMCLDTYVHHSGGVSFGDEKSERVENAIKHLNRLHPNYDYEVHKFIAKDPIKNHRIKALIELFHETSAQKILLISHNLGGGTKEHIKELVSSFNDQACFLLLTPETEDIFKLSFEIGDSVQFLPININENFDDFISLLNYLNVSLIHFHHTMGIVPKVLNLAEVLKVPFYVTLHDYYCINANPTQSDINGAFCDDKETRDSLCQESYPIPHATAEQWRENQVAFLSKATRIFSPSSYVAKYFREYFPSLNITASYHPEWEKNYPYPAVTPVFVADKQKMRILVHGAISKEKGADILEQCAVYAEKNNLLLEFHLLGYAYKKLKSCVIEHGSYKPDEIINLIKEINPHLIWFPALWPETYSYTLSEALMCGLPVVAPDFGSFPERLEKRPLSWVVPWDQPIEDRVGCFGKIKEELVGRAANEPIPWDEQPISNNEFNYKANYLPESSRKFSATQFDTHAFVAHCFKEEFNVLNFREKILLHLLRIKHNKIIRFCVERTPEPIIQRIKSLFTERTFDDIEDKGGNEGK